MAIVAQIPYTKVHQTWPLVEDFFAKVEPYMHGEYTLSQMRLKIGMGDWWLITFTDNDTIIGAMSVIYQNRANDRVAFILALAGENLTTHDNWEQLCSIFKKDGATFVEAAMRPSTFRLWKNLGFSEKYRIAGTPL